LRYETGWWPLEGPPLPCWGWEWGGGGGGCGWAVDPGTKEGALPLRARRVALTAVRDWGSALLPGGWLPLPDQPTEYLIVRPRITFCMGVGGGGLISLHLPVV